MPLISIVRIRATAIQGGDRRKAASINGGNIRKRKGEDWVNIQRAVTVTRLRMARISSGDCLIWRKRCARASNSRLGVTIIRPSSSIANRWRQAKTDRTHE
ncbi:hypothetical protein D3C87_1161640 [compost metagenome]